MTKLQAYWQLTRMNRPIGALLLMWPTLWALFISAQGMPDLKVLVVFVLGVFLMRSAGCVINDYADRKVDGHVKRTKLRPIPAGLVTEKQALGLFFILVLASFLLVLTMNRLTILLAFAGVALAFIYPFMKRYTHFPQVFLGFAFGWSIPMAWAAQTGEVDPQAWALFLINLCWVLVYDTQYAMVDRDDDLQIGIKSTAIIFGKQDKLIIATLQMITLAGLVWLGLNLGLSHLYYASIAGAGALFVYQQVLIKDRQRDPCFKAFLNNNHVGMLIFIGLLLHFFL